MKDIYSVAVVGAGSGGRLSMKAAAASERFALKAVADVSEAARRDVEAQFPGVSNVCRSRRRCFGNVPTDVVVVATWPPSHLQIALAALQTPLTGIVVEKPLADTYADGASILQRDPRGEVCRW